MPGAIAFVFGLCALSFAAGCVLTAYMLRRELEEPDDCATRPIHEPVPGRWPPGRESVAPRGDPPTLPVERLTGSLDVPRRAFQGARRGTSR
ncbi:hypothetical protein [Saccharothrix obliqua]|uniref:hypothetical protein n=1 Tax=Saccharothrix obliqua TaxID=2861747 RepID=UPI001C5D1D6D|nr:hypothetical protein [Saccharothrix obliqua]MBW4716549.1 hypothetical protein [Saccharothrix obliqua]